MNSQLERSSFNAGEGRTLNQSVECGAETAYNRALFKVSAFSCWKLNDSRSRNLERLFCVKLLALHKPSDIFKEMISEKHLLICESNISMEL